MRANVILAFFFFFSAFLSSTAQRLYIPLKSDTSGLAVLKRQINKASEEDIKSVPLTKDTEKSSSLIKKLYKERAEHLVKGLDSNQFLLKTPLNIYMNTIMQEIGKSNPEIPMQKVRLLISRDKEVNACSYGEGTLVFNIGLLDKLENESQIAFVLCHEIAHYMMNHSYIRLKKEADAYYSTQTQKEIKTIAKGQYNKFESLNNFFTNMELTQMVISRAHERQADSLGFVYLSRTKYDETQILSALNILDHADEQDSTHIIDYKKVFNFTQYPFQSEWLDNEEELVMSVVKTKKDLELEDSLKTHPDCKVRMKYFNGIVKNPAKLKFIQSESLFANMRLLSSYEIIQYCYDSKRLSLTIYQALKLRMDFPDDSYLVSTIANCMMLLEIAKEKHIAGVFVPLAHSAYYPNYAELIRLLTDWRVSELSNVAMYYTVQYYDTFKDEQYVYACYNACKRNGYAIEAAAIRTDYERVYPNGQYISKL